MPEVALVLAAAGLPKEKDAAAGAGEDDADDDDEEEAAGGPKLNAGVEAGFLAAGSLSSSSSASSAPLFFLAPSSCDADDWPKPVKPPKGAGLALPAADWG